MTITDNRIASPITRDSLKRKRAKENFELVLAREYGPPPSNLLKEIRTGENTTLEEMAARIGISKQALIRVEQGTFDRILPSVLDYYTSNYPYTELLLVDSYEDYQTKQRARHYHYFGPNLEVSLEVHPFRELRLRIDVTATEVAKDLCLPQATLTYFEKKIKHQKSVPKGLVNVFHEIGYTGQQIKGFCRDYETYRLKVLAK